jgi:alpha-tubulin suppressor-like RCC1 family protein
VVGVLSSRANLRRHYTPHTSPECSAPGLRELGRLGAPETASNCGVRLDGSIECWGLTVPGSPPAGTFTRLSRGNTSHYCALRTDGTVACWGADDYGESDPPAGSYLGLATTFNLTAGIRSDFGLDFWGTGSFSFHQDGPFAKIALGEEVNCALHADATLECFGAGNWPAEWLPLPASGSFGDVVVDANTGCAIAADGSIACWGDNAYGKATPPPGAFISIAVASQHGCGVRTDHSVSCWGTPEFGYPTVF